MHACMYAQYLNTLYTLQGCSPLGEGGVAQANSLVLLVDRGRVAEASNVGRAVWVTLANCIACVGLQRRRRLKGVGL